MTTVLKICGVLFSFLFFLSITLNDQTIFEHIYGVISPATTYVQNTAEKFFNSSVAGTKTYSKKIFDNSVPKLKDSVDSKLSGRSKKVNAPAERITEEEKAELNQLIKNH